MFNFLLVIQALVSAAMVTVILMQRSEGGGLGVGGSPSGLMSARGAADFLSRATAVLATAFVVLSITLAGLATVQRGPIRIDPSQTRRPTQNAPLLPPVSSTPPVADPLAGAAQKGTAAQPAPAGNGSVPIAQ
ncbi:MAG: secG [Alphaproteobacteria bacterium]|nr:secG [Alphaproteobacteria bacterium]